MQSASRNSSLLARTPPASRTKTETKEQTRRKGAEEKGRDRHLRREPDSHPTRARHISRGWGCIHTGTHARMGSSMYELGVAREASGDALKRSSSGTGGQGMEEGGRKDDERREEGR